MLIVKMESFFTSLIKNVEIIPKMTPRTIAPMVSSRNSMTIYSGCISPPLTSSRLMVSNTIHVPSLNKLSPYINELNFFGAPAYFNNANTATVSVHDKTDPNMNASGMLKKESSNCIMNFRLNMIANALTSTDGNARMNICTDCLRKMYQSELKAP